MKLKDWDQRYRSGEAAFDTPAPLVKEIAGILAPGQALDLACGAGRNAIYLAELGWRVRAVDGSAAAIETLHQRARSSIGTSKIEAAVVDLERQAFPIPPCTYDLIVSAYYLQRDLLSAMTRGLRQGGVIILIAHVGEQATPRRAASGELRSMFEGWEILHYCEGAPRESCHRQPVAEIAARKP